MRGLGRLFLVISTLFIFAAGGILCTHALGWINIGELLFGRGLIVGATGGFLLILGFVVVFVGLQSIQPEQTMTFDNPEGLVEITFGAIEEFVRKLSKEIEGIHELRPQVVKTKKGIEIRNRVVLKHDVNVPQTTTQIQSAIRERTRGVLGIENISGVKVFVTRIAPEETHKRAKAKEAKPSE